jgi:hypothetical protein
LRLSGRTEEARSVLQKALFRNAHSPRFRKLWNEFRFHQARRRETQRQRQGENEAEGELPVLLPFVRVVTETAPDGSACPTIVRCEDASRSLRLPRRADQSSAQ